MIETFDIAGYARISVDDEQEQKNISIENQKAIIEDYVKTHFPGSTLTFFEDRDRSGYTFDQREGYQELRRGLMRHKYDILIIKDFSRFSRRNSRGLVELEDLRDAGVRIVSIGDGIDFPNDDDWLKIQFQFLVNEMPVTDTSRKVRSVVKRRQNDGEWICAAPYGYIVTEGKQFEIIPTEAATVRQIFDLYNNAGWGYKKIANYLTDEGVPTPRMSERMRKEAAGKKTKRDAKNAWAIATVQGILDNDFYIGTLRQGKYTRAKINGKDIKRNDDEHIVIENHHQAIIDYRTFAITRALREKRSRNNYRGVKVNDNVYSGFLQCGDCGSPLFAMSRSDLAPAYTCGTYHRRGLKGCTSHHIRVDKLDELLKSYVRKLAENSAEMLKQLNEELKRENDQVAETEQSADNLAAVLDDLTEELKVTKRQRIREIMKKPEQEASIEALYDEMEDDLQKKIDGLNHQIDLLSDKRNTIIQVNRVAKTAIDVFHDILEKDKLERNDLELLIGKILVFEDHLEIKLKTDIDTLLRCGTLEDAANFKQGTKNIESTLIQSSKGHEDKVFRVRVISDGDPLEIYTSREGEVIFKKYSLLGGLEDFAAQFCDALNRTSGFTAAVTDRDAVIAITGAGKRELLGKSLSEALSRVMEERRIYCCQGADQPLPVTDGNDRYTAAVAAPILCEGDVLGLVLFLSAEGQVPGEGEYKLAQTVSAFLGKHMES
ncbi:recombinase family protein [Oscillospiraceae bacterium CLA-AA-H272]|uniref:Recombinase family protein n=1 Tax=Brotocaccenecus cirricatena TaxID=3064195 RepID=A0AAE3AJ83_9FIRM|nr:stage V sporulation T C-terminal domain-containing protein [Brotocaccenecus cirricatena]MCC2130988.1 recombinase family protein [Brotocaccenecus cirricatena]